MACYNSFRILPTSKSRIIYAGVVIAECNQRLVCWPVANSTEQCIPVVDLQCVDPFYKDIFNFIGSHDLGTLWMAIMIVYNYKIII